MSHRDTSIQYVGLKLRLFTQPGPVLYTTQGHKHPIDIGLTVRVVHKVYRSVSII